MATTQCYWKSSKMAKFSFLSNVAMAAAGAYALTRYSPGHAPIVNLNPYSTFSIIYSLILAWKIVYHMFLYPKWLSPLNKLPKPPAGGSWYNGFFWECFGTGTGEMETMW